MKIVVIGGVAAGASAAARARRMNDSAEIIVLERGPYVSFANCGLPYYVGGDIPNRENLLLVSPELFKNRYHIDVRLHHNVTAIDRKQKLLQISTPIGELTQDYDKLIIAPGCEPVVPPIPGVDKKNIHTVFTISDVDAIVDVLGSVRSALVVGGGFIGIETAEALLKRGIDTSMVELREQLMTIFDPEFSKPMEQHLRDAGLKLKMGCGVTAFTGDDCVTGAALSDGSQVEAQLVIMAAGLRPNVSLARDCGLRLGSTGAILVNEYMQTEDPDVYAVGDAVEGFHRVSGRPIRVSLATSANRQGRIAGNNAAGAAPLRYQGTLATSVIRIADITAACTGLNEADAVACGFDCYSVFVPAASNATYFPGSGWLILKIVAEKVTGRLLGAQAIGEKGVEKRIDVLATAIYAGLTVLDLENLDLCYAPPYSSAKGPEIMGGMIASNALRGDTKLVTPARLEQLLRDTGAELIDLRTQAEWDQGHIPGARHIPLDTLRADPGLLSPGKPYVFYCGVGLRAHNGCRFMTQLGYDVYNLTGGWNAYLMDV